MDSSHPINVQMLVDYAELKMQEKRDLSLRFFPPFVFRHRKISTDSPSTPPHPTCLVLGMAGAIRAWSHGMGGRFQPHGHSMGRALKLPYLLDQHCQEFAMDPHCRVVLQIFAVCWVRHKKQSRTFQRIPSPVSPQGL